MKKLFSIPFILVLALIPMLSLSSCDSDDPNNWPDIDYYPITFDISCVNSLGLDLLDTETEGNIVNNDIRVLYDGEWYRLSESAWPEHASRTYFAQWHTPYIETVKAPDGAMTKTIRIGEIDGGKTATTDIILSIGNRSFNLSVTNKVKPGTLKVTRHYYLDGKKIDNDRGFYSIILK